MLTRWGKALNPEAVLAEYPRPQLERNSYLNLNGYWDYAIKASGDGLPRDFEGKILVPFSPESELSGVGRSLNPDQVLWYRRRIRLPNGFRKSRLMLHFGAVDQAAAVFINGESVGGHVGGFTPFTLDVSDAWNDGAENEIVVRVQDTTDTSWHSRGKQKAKRGGIWYTPQSGIWQTVWMESVPTVYIRGLVLTPDYDAGEVEVLVEASEPGRPFSIEIDELDGKTFSAPSDAAFRIKIPDFIPWTPENPKLYACTVSLGDDAVKSYFGMRKFSNEKDADGTPRFFLNNRPYFQSGLLDQGYWSDGMLTAPADEALIADIRMAKDMGFNLLRKHIKLEPLRWYYHCDRLGMIVWQDMPNGGEAYKPWLITVPAFLDFKMSDRRYGLFSRGKAEGREQYYRELSEMLNHLRNVVSIAVWVPFNEGWGQFDAAAATEFIRARDRTRLIDSASGWFDQGCGDFLSKHIYFRPYRFAPDRRSRAVALTEFGGYNLRIADHAFNEKDFGYKRLTSRAALADELRKLYDTEIKTAVERGLSAAIYTQLSDVEDELNGLITYDREVMKVTPEVFRMIHDGLRGERDRHC